MTSEQENQPRPPITAREIIFLSKEDPEGSFFAISLLTKMRTGDMTIDQMAQELAELEDDEHLTHKAALTKALVFLRNHAELFDLRVSDNF